MIRIQVWIVQGFVQMNLSDRTTGNHLMLKMTKPAARLAGERCRPSTAGQLDGSNSFHEPANRTTFC
jgi:hypothetical protein